MAYDKIVDSAALDGALTDIADAIREKTGSTEKMTMDGMAAAIAGIQAGGGNPYPNIEVVTIATEFSRANAAKVVLGAMVSEGQTTIFVRKTANFPSGACIMACFNLPVAQSSDGYARWRSANGISGANTWSETYDLVANVGDEYYKVVL